MARSHTRQPAGPFYHPIEPLSVDNDLLYHQDTESRADGEVIFIRSRLLNQTGKPIKNARIEIWQANAHGRYNHPRHANSNLPLDPNFFGFGHTLTEPEGHYRFRSIKPAPYSDNLEWLRPPHIHFAVIPEGGTPWLTQMSFAGEALNKRDFLLRNLPSDVVRERGNHRFPNDRERARCARQIERIRYRPRNARGHPRQSVTRSSIVAFRHFPIVRRPVVKRRRRAIRQQKHNNSSKSIPAAILDCAGVRLGLAAYEIRRGRITRSNIPLDDRDSQWYRRALACRLYGPQALAVPRRNPHRCHLRPLQRDGLVLFLGPWAHHVEFRSRNDPRLYASALRVPHRLRNGPRSTHDAPFPRPFCGMCAIAALSARDFQAFGESPFGVLAILGGAVCFAIGATLQKRTWRTPSFVLAGWQMILGSIPLLILAPIFDRDPFAEFTLYGAGAVAYTVLVGNMIGFVLWIKILELIPAPIATISLLPVPMVGIMSGVLILGESVGWQEGVAVLLITTALASTLNLPSKKNAKKNPPPPKP